MIAETIEGFNPEPLTVKRVNDSTTFVNGLAQVVTDVVEFNIDRASVQPMLAKERLLLPEMIRDRELLKIYTECELKSVDVEGKKRADRLTYKSQEYVVQSVEDWNSHGNFYKVIAVKEND